MHGDHDEAFWKLTRRIEEEVERGDWRSGGRSLTDEVFYEPGEDVGEVDGGGWTGGEFVLGGGGGDGGGEMGGIGRREAIARAAEERAKKQREVMKKGG